MDGRECCPDCGSALPANAPQGLCPACLLGQGLVIDGPDASPHLEPAGTEGVEEDGPSSAPLGTARDDATTVGLSSAMSRSSDSRTTQSFHPGSDPDTGADRPEPGSLVRHFGDYELLNELGRGGMGIVYQARQFSLNRLVALKMLQAGTLATEDDLRRFQNEAEAVAMLDHPNIVPILEVGQHQGRRYFSMKLIGGPSLDRKLGTFTSDLKVASRLVKTVAEAVHHAHQRGILHRDLKPGNVLLDEHGEPHVTDFGLAKRVQADRELTLSGAILGTPGYMAPEQTSGKRGMVTTATDVYGLGAILYSVMTGRAPFRGDSPAETLEQVREWTPEPPSKRNPRIPRDLEVIVLKCLEKEPERRYSSAAALADDLRRHLNGEPILARTAGRATRAWMWCKRNPALARLAAALLLVALFLLMMSVGVVVVDLGRRREAEARAHAEANLRVARKALDDYFTRVSEDTLLKGQDSVDLRRLRVELLGTTLSYYREFLRERAGDPASRRERAEAQYRVGRIRREIGPPEEAIAAFRAAVAIWEELRAAAPEDRDLHLQLARTELALGEQLAWVRDFAPSFTELNRARDLFEGLVAERPADADYRSGLAECDRELGIAEGEAGMPDRGLEHLMESEGILRRLLSDSPGNIGYRKQLADAVNARGFILSKKGKDDEALRAFGEFQEIGRSMLAEHRSGPKPAEILMSLGMSHYNEGAILYSRDRRKSLEYMEKSLEYLSALVESHPSVSDHREKLAQSLAEVAPLRHEFGRSAEAFAATRKAIEMLEALVESQPDQPRFRAELGRAQNMLGYLHDEFRENRQALAAFERARVEEARACVDSPGTELYKVSLIDILLNLGEQYADLGQPDRGLPYYQQAAELSRSILAAHPRERERTLGLAEHLERLAAVERSAGKAEAAQRIYAEAAAALDALTAGTADSEVEVRRGVLLMGEGFAAADRGLSAEADDLLRRAVEALAPFGASAKGDPAPRRRLSEALWERARLLRSTEGAAEADRLDAERRTIWQHRPVRELADLALEEATQAGRIGYGRVPVDDRAAAVRRLGLDLAADHLRLAIAMGFRDVGSLRKHPDAELLLSREDLRTLIMDAAFPAWPFGETS